MPINFNIGDTIWWLDTRCIDKPRIRNNTIILIEWEKYYARYKFEIGNDLDDKTTYIWSPNTLVARSKEELIEILYPTKIGPFDYNQLVYVIRGDENTLKITKAYIKGPTVFTSSYKVSTVKDITTELERMTTVFDASIGDIYSTLDLAKQTIENWLNNNDS